MFKKKLVFIFVPLLVIMLVTLSGCGSSMAGTYHGTSGRTTMTLSKDGSAGYGEITANGDSKTWHGKWKVSGNSIHIVLKSSSDYGFNLKVRFMIKTRLNYLIKEVQGKTILGMMKLSQDPDKTTDSRKK